jgi:uncharacterized protein YcbK (DUF882 family)
MYQTFENRGGVGGYCELGFVWMWKGKRATYAYT